MLKGTPAWLPEFAGNIWILLWIERHGLTRLANSVSFVELVQLLPAAWKRLVPPKISQLPTD
jgi:hypothetical protein